MNTITRKNAMPGKQAESRVPGTAAAPRAPAKVTPERVQERAYEIFRSRNGGWGDAASDWLQAERELNEDGI